MSIRVAVTSADGALINQHFGHAGRFFIYDVEADGTAVLVETREVVPWCRKDNHDDDEGDAGIANDIKDCRAVLTAKAGGPAREKLELSGLDVFTGPAVITEALEKVAAWYTERQR